MGSPDSSKKKVANLRVQDLKLELEKRGLDNKGVKAVLIERLQKALIENGEDPNEITVDSPATPKSATKKTPTRKRVSKGKVGEEEGESDYDGEEGLVGEAMVVDEVIGDMDTSQEDSTIKTSEEIDLDIILGGPEDDDDDVLNISLEEDQLFTEEETEGFALDSEKASSNQEDKMEAEDSSATEVEGARDDAKAGDSLALVTASDAKGEGSESLVVHVDEPFMSELDEELAESSAPSKRSEDELGAASGDALPEDDNRLTDTQTESPREKGEKESPEKANKGDKSPAGAAHEEEEGGDRATPARASATGKDASADKRGTSSAGAANSRSKSSGSSSRSPTSKDDKDRRGSGSSRTGGGTTSGRNLWVSNLSRNTRAADLKASFSKYGKVVGAKVVTNAKGPRAFCYGFVSMSSSSEAAKAINHLHRTELHGRTIHVERARSNMIPIASVSGASARKEPSPEAKDGKDAKDKAEKKPADSAKAGGESGQAADQAKPTSATPASATSSATAAASSEGKDGKTPASADKKEGAEAKEGGAEEEEVKKEEKTPTDAAKQKGSSDKQPEGGTPDKKTDSGSKKDEEPSEGRRSRSSTVDTEKEKPDPKDRKDILSLEKIKEQRLQERQRKRERNLREIERRREREREDSLRREREMIRRRQREEEERLRREREQLRMAQQQERLERQSIEWERLKLHQERENLQRELEQHRQMEVQLRLAAERQATLKRSLDTRSMAPRDIDPYAGDQKRRPPAGVPQQAGPVQGGRGEFGNNRPAVAVNAPAANTERPPDRFNRRDTRQTDQIPRRDNAPMNKFTGPPNRHLREDVRRNDQGRREDSRRDDSRQRPANTSRNEPMRREDPPPRRTGPPQQQQQQPQRPAPPPQQQQQRPAPQQQQQQQQQQRRDDNHQRRGPDTFRRDDTMKRRDQPERRMDTAPKPVTRNEPRQDTRRVGNYRDDRQGQPTGQNDRYQGGQGQSRGGQTGSYSRDGANSRNVRDGHRDRDREDRPDRSRESSHQSQSRMGGSHGDSRDNWKGGRDSGVSNTAGRSSDWKSNQRSGGDRSYDRDSRSQNYDRGQSNNWSSSNRSSGRNDQMMRSSDQHSHRGSLLGTPPMQDAAWSGGNMDNQMHRGSGSVVVQGASSHISTLMNQSQPISSLLNNPSMSGPYISGGSVSGGLGGGVGVVHQVPGSSYISNQIGIGGSGGGGGSMDRHQSSQSDSRFPMRRY